jgi:hypothetical protein
MTFRVGQKVVCIKGPRRHRDLTQPKIGEVYTIRLIYPSSFTGEPGFLLEEIVNGLHPNGREYGFYADRFRPVIERKTDISFAHEILRKASKPARAPAVTSPQWVSP